MAILLERRHPVEERQGRRQGTHAGAMNDQGLKPSIPLHPKHLERAVFEDLLLSHCQLNPRRLFNQMLQYCLSLVMSCFCYGCLGHRRKSKMCMEGTQSW